MSSELAEHKHNAENNTSSLSETKPSKYIAFPTQSVLVTFKFNFIERNGHQMLLRSTCPGDFCTHFELFIDAQLPDLLQFQAQMTLLATMIDMASNRRLT